MSHNKKLKEGRSSKGALMHFSVGAVIKKGEKYLLIDRATPPWGFAGPAGHIDEGESEIESLKREVEEETGLKIKDCKLLFEEELGWNWCSAGIQAHYWYLYECNATGKIKRDTRETKSIGWYSVGEIKKLELEPVWKYWFEKMGVL